MMQPYERSEVSAYNRIMAQSFRRFTGQSIIDGDTDALSDRALAEAMFDAPQAIVSHGKEADPIFRYANRKALELWEMDWKAFTRLPSRLSAESMADIQSDRDALLKAALQKGWVDNYQGIRVSSTGKRFYIDQTVLWNVVDENGIRHGQAAFIRQWRHIAP
jgi:hypothetical protein